jgi:hypothetical protein
MTLSTKALEWLLFICTWLAALSTFIVVYGLYLENTHSRSGVERPLRVKWGEMLVLAGVMGEFAFGLMAFAFSSRIDTRQRAEIAGLENQLAWRSLTEEQRQRLFTAVSPFIGERVDIFVYVGDVEADALGWQLYSVLKTKAGLQASTPTRITALSKILFGIQVEVGSTNEILGGAIVRRIALKPRDRKLADVLASQLREMQLTPFANHPVDMLYPPELDIGDTPVSEAPVRIMIGVKPR